MRVTRRLLRALNKVFDTDPHQSLALRMQYAGGMTWVIRDGVLTTSVTGGPGQGFSVDLLDYTVASLAAWIGRQPGYSVVYVSNSMANLSAMVLLDTSGNIALSNGDHLYGYTSLLWMFFEGASVELQAAATQIQALPLEMSLTTADGEWLDYLGGYYGVPRLAGELDAQYAPRIQAEVLRPKSNNLAIEIAIEAYTGTAVTVTDVVGYSNPTPAYNGAITYNGTSEYNATGHPLYGLFDINVGYDLLNGLDISSFGNTVASLIERLRAAGTHLRALSLSGSQLSDTYSGSSEVLATQPIAVTAALSDAANAYADAIGTIPVTMAGIVDAANPTSDSSTLTASYTTTYNGQRTYSAAIYYASGGSVAGSLEGPP